MSVAVYFSGFEFIPFHSVTRGCSTWDQMMSYNLWVDCNALNKPSDFLGPPKEAAPGSTGSGLLIFLWSPAHDTNTASWSQASGGWWTLWVAAKGQAGTVPRWLPSNRLLDCMSYLEVQAAGSLPGISLGKPFTRFSCSWEGGKLPLLFPNLSSYTF